MSSKRQYFNAILQIFLILSCLLVLEFSLNCLDMTFCGRNGVQNTSFTIYENSLKNTSKINFWRAIVIMRKTARTHSKFSQKTRKKFQAIQKNSNSTRFIFPKTRLSSNSEKLGSNPPLVNSSRRAEHRAPRLGGCCNMGLWVGSPTLHSREFIPGTSLPTTSGN